MTVWGAGAGFKLGGSPGVAVAGTAKVAAWLVWDHCGDIGLLLMLEYAVSGGLQAELPIVVELNVEAMKGFAVLPWGNSGGCITDLDGWAVGADAEVKAIGGVHGGLDATSHGQLLVTVGLELETGAGVAGEGHITRKWLVPIVTGNCPCNRSWAGAIFDNLMPGAGVVNLISALGSAAIG